MVQTPAGPRHDAVVACPGAGLAGTTKQWRWYEKKCMRKTARKNYVNTVFTPRDLVLKGWKWAGTQGRRGQE